jgi:hypothetical protein
MRDQCILLFPCSIDLFIIIFQFTLHKQHINKIPKNCFLNKKLLVQHKEIIM